MLKTWLPAVSAVGALTYAVLLILVVRARGKRRFDVVFCQLLLAMFVGYAAVLMGFRLSLQRFAALLLLGAALAVPALMLHASVEYARARGSTGAWLTALTLLAYAPIPFVVVLVLNTGADRNARSELAQAYGAWLVAASLVSALFQIVFWRKADHVGDRRLHLSAIVFFAAVLCAVVADAVRLSDSTPLSVFPLPVIMGIVFGWLLVRGPIIGIAMPGKEPATPNRG